MANLKELREKIGVVQSTRKVTAAMKLVAGVKLRKVEQRVSASREYSDSLYKILSNLRNNFVDFDNELFSGRKNISSEMIIMFSSDRGLCGNYNYMMGKAVQNQFNEAHINSVNMHLLCVGTKLNGLIEKYADSDDVIEQVADFYFGDMFGNAQKLAQSVIEQFSAKIVDRVSILYTHYYSAVKRIVTKKQIIPLDSQMTGGATATIFEPNIEEVLNALLPYNVSMQIYQAALESMCSEQSARMTAMDNATRNADDLLSELTIHYNRTRQYGITQELTEVISGAQAIN